MRDGIASVGGRSAESGAAPPSSEASRTGGFTFAVATFAGFTVVRTRSAVLKVSKRLHSRATRLAGLSLPKLWSGGAICWRSARAWLDVPNELDLPTPASPATDIV